MAKKTKPKLSKPSLPPKPDPLEKAAALHADAHRALDHFHDSQRVFSTLVSRLCFGMDEGDRFYHAKDNTWWEWRNGTLVRSGSPPKKQGPRLKTYYENQARTRAVR